MQAMANEFFDELRDPNCKLPTSNPLPPLFDFSEHELSIEPAVNRKLVPSSQSLLAGAEPSSSGVGLNDVGMTSASTTENDGNINVASGQENAETPPS